MTEEELVQKLEELTGLAAETEHVEFKVNNSRPQEIGEYMSALSNSACLQDQEHGWMIWGVEDGSHWWRSLKTGWKSQIRESR